MFQHYYYDNLIIDKKSEKNNLLIDDYLKQPKNSRVFPGDFSYTGVFQKLSMLGFTVSSINNGEAITVKQVFCLPSEIDALNKLIFSLE